VCSQNMRGFKGIDLNKELILSSFLDYLILISKNPQQSRQ